MLRTMPTSQNRDMGHPLLCLVGESRPILCCEIAQDGAPGNGRFPSGMTNKKTTADRLPSAKDDN